MWYSSIYRAHCRILTSYAVAGFAPCGCDGASPEDCRASQLLASRSHYTLSLYYSIVILTTLGYGDVTPSNVEYVVASGLALAGVLVLSVLIGSVGALMERERGGLARSGSGIEGAVGTETRTMPCVRGLSQAKAIQLRAHDVFGHVEVVMCLE